MIKACIFDLDGTLADTVESIACAGNRALEAVGLKPLPMENYKYYAGDGAKTLVERALFDAGDKALLKIEEALTHSWPPLEATSSEQISVSGVKPCSVTKLFSSYGPSTLSLIYTQYLMFNHPVI